MPPLFPGLSPFRRRPNYSSPIRSAAINASCGIDTFPPAFAGAGRLRRSRILRMKSLFAHAQRGNEGFLRN